MTGKRAVNFGDVSFVYDYDDSGHIIAKTPRTPSSSVAIKVHGKVEGVEGSVWRSQRPQPVTQLVAQQATKIRLDNPCATLQSIADECGVTRERVRQILSKEQLPTKHYSQSYVCLNCGSAVPKRRLFCCPKCRYEYSHPLVECTECHTLFRRPYAHEIIRVNRLFCSKKCQGRWVAEKYGFGVRPENTGRRLGKSKYDLLLPQIVSLLQEGCTLYEVCVEQRIPLSNWSMLRCKIVQNYPDVEILKKKRTSKYAIFVPCIAELMDDGLTLWGAMRRLSIPSGWATIKKLLEIYNSAYVERKNDD